MSLATLTIDINARMANIERDMGRLAHVAENAANTIGSSFAKASVLVTGINQAFELASRALDGMRSAGSFVVDFVKHTADAQDEMGKLAQKAGMSTEAFSGLSYAAQLADASNEALVKGTKELGKNIVEAARAGDAGTTVFGNMGIRIKDTAGNLRGTDQILLDVAGKFAGMEDGAYKGTTAVQLFGKAGLDLIPFLNQGKDGIAALTQEADRLGLVVGGDAARASEQFNDNLRRMELATEGVKRSIGNAALPVLSELVQQLTDVKMAGGGVAGELRALTTQNNIEEWAQAGARALAWVYDSGKAVAVVFKDVGGSLGAMAAATSALLQGEFDKAQAINEQWQQDSLALYNFTPMRDKVDTWFDEYRRTVRVNGQRILVDTEAQAKESQKIWDEHQAKLNQNSGKFYEFDEAALKKQDALREKYSAAEKIRVYGETAYKKEQIEKRYADELALVRGAADQAALEVEIRRRMADEIATLERGTAQAAVDGNATVLASAAQGAASRVAIETQAAQQTMQVWSQANAAKAGATGGQIMNAGTPGEFVSSWDASGKYVGDLGSPVSSPGALGNAYSTSGRRLSVQEQIAMLNGYARFASGGSFMVGGTGGTDSQLVAFKASPDERVTIQTPEQQRASGGVTFNVNVANGNPSAIIAAIKQLLRTDPGMFSGSLTRAG